MGLISYEKAESHLLGLFDNQSSLKKSLDKIKKPKGKIEYLRAQSINQIINQVKQKFLEKEEEILKGELKEDLISQIDSKIKLEEIRKLNKKEIYPNVKTLQIEAAGFEVLGELLKLFLETLESRINDPDNKKEKRSKTIFNLIKDQFDDENPPSEVYKRILKVTDYVSGMTDSFAVSYFKKLKGISLPTP